MEKYFSNHWDYKALRHCSPTVILFPSVEKCITFAGDQDNPQVFMGSFLNDASRAAWFQTSDSN